MTSPARALAALLCVGALPAWAADRDAGQQLFEASCARCHSQGLSTAPDELAAVLRTRSIPRHRFVLSDEQVRQLAEYLRTAPAAP